MEADQVQGIEIWILIDRGHTRGQGQGHALIHQGQGHDLHHGGIMGTGGGIARLLRQGESAGDGKAPVIQASQVIAIGAAVGVEIDTDAADYSILRSPDDSGVQGL